MPTDVHNNKLQKGDIVLVPKELIQSLVGVIVEIRDGGLLVSGKVPVAGKNEALLVTGNIALQININLNFDPNRPVNLFKLAMPKQEINLS